LEYNIFDNETACSIFDSLLQKGGGFSFTFVSNTIPFGQNL